MYSVPNKLVKGFIVFLLPFSTDLFPLFLQSGCEAVAGSCAVIVGFSPTLKILTHIADLVFINHFHFLKRRHNREGGKGKEEEEGGKAGGYER